MSDNSGTETKTKGKAVAAGDPVRSTTAPPFSAPITAEVPVETPVAAAATALTPPTPAAGEGPKPGQDPAPTELDQEKVRTFLKGMGIDGFDTLEDLKSKLEKSSAPATAEPTAEEKAAQEKAFENRMLNHYISHGGTAEQFVQIKQLASAENLKDLSVSEITREMKKEGFDDDEIALVLKERYYQLNPDEIEKDELEDQEAFDKRKALVKKKVTYGSKLLENRGLPIKKQAQGILQGIREAVSNEDLLAVKEAELSSKVEEYAKQFGRDITLELGEVNSQKIDPVSFKVSEEDISTAVAILKNPEERNKFFYKDNSLNIDNVLRMIIERNYLKSALKAVYLEGSGRQVAEFKKVFPYSTPHDLGVGGNQTAQRGQKGKLVSAGEPEHVRR